MEEKVIHFPEIAPELRWKNDLLNELRAIRQLLENGRDAQAPKQEADKPEKRPYQRRGGRP